MRTDVWYSVEIEHESGYRYRIVVPMSELSEKLAGLPSDEGLSDMEECPPPSGDEDETP